MSESAVQSMPFGSPHSTKGERPKMSRDLSTLLAHRGSLGRIVALVANERLVHIVFRPADQLYYISPLPSALTGEQVLKERFIISGSAPFHAQQIEPSGNVVPALMHESDIQLGTYCFQQQLVGDNHSSSSWTDVDDNVTADRFVHVLCRWTGWDIKLTSVFEERIRCSAQYLADTYAENRPCPTRESDYITWEQAIVEANGHPLHKCRMPVDPRTQPTIGFDFKRADIAFMAVKRDILATYGSLETELEPLLAVAGIDTVAAVDSSEIVIPVHEFQVRFLLSLPKAMGQLRLLPQKVKALAQSSTRSMTVPSLPGLCVKLSLSLIIGGSLRTIESRSAFMAVRYWTAGMLDASKVVGLQGTPIEILEEVACANGLGDHLAVEIRWDPYHSSRPPVNSDIGYAVAGALCEPAVIGQMGCVAETVFELTSLSQRLDFLRDLLMDTHGQNALLRFSRPTGQLLGFSARDWSGTRFNRAHFERTTGIMIDERMIEHDMPVPDLLDRGYFIFFVVHFCPLIIALDLHRLGPASFTSTDLLQGRASDKEASDLAKGNGWAVVARELHNTLRMYETLEGENAASISARELSAAARTIKYDKDSTVLVPNMMIG
ncbi:MAG: hypothetical protein ASARMPRED_000595 [Alectoria sarmentosa]|nr:MAG: hypothetical protein ASARMPRED_000595 [Alectoria sarmentosa]